MLTWDEAMLWQTYTMLTDPETVFHSLKSELGLVPYFTIKKKGRKVICLSKSQPIGQYR